MLRAAQWNGSQLPEDLKVSGDLVLSDCTGLTSLPEGLKTNYLNLRGCTGLTSLPKGLKTNSLNLNGCTGLTSLPEGLKISWCLDLSGCTGLTSLPKRIEADSLCLRGCTGLTSLPEGLKTNNLCLSGCTGLLSLPKNLEVDELLLDHHQVLSKDGSVFIDKDIGSVFIDGFEVPRSLAEHCLTIEEFRELSAEQRRLAIVIMGIKWLVDNSKPEILDMDDHRLNGQRCLLRMEGYCCLVCGDPSTGRVFYMEVPSRIKTCQEADAYLNTGLKQNRQVGRT